MKLLPENQLAIGTCPGIPAGWEFCDLYPAYDLHPSGEPYPLNSTIIPEQHATLLKKGQEI